MSKKIHELKINEVKTVVGGASLPSYSELLGSVSLSVTMRPQINSVASSELAALRLRKR